MDFNLKEYAMETVSLQQLECFEQLMLFLRRLRPLLKEIHSEPSSKSEEIEVKKNLAAAGEFLRFHKNRRSLFLFVFAKRINKDVEQLVQSIGQSLLLLLPSLISLPQEITSSLVNLSQEMLQASYEIAGEEIDLDLHSEKLNPLILKLSRHLKIHPDEDRAALVREIRYLKEDLISCSDENNEKMMNAVNKLLTTLAPNEEDEVDDDDGVDDDEEEPIPAFDSFECPLTKQVMEDPVVLQSEHTYERTAIQHWFQVCREQKREMTCPVSKKVLASTELLPNLVLRQTIEEWYVRNVSIRLKIAVKKLQTLGNSDTVGEGLDEITGLANERSINKYKLKEAGLIPHILNIWTLKGASLLRIKALVILRKMTVDDEENQVVIVNEGGLRFTVKSLGSHNAEEKRNAAEILCKISENKSICARLGSEKGAIIHLVSLTEGSDDIVASLAERTLSNLEQEDSNIFVMAEAGRLKPLITRLCTGSEEVQVEMAGYLKKHLIDSHKSFAATSAASVLVAMLSRNAQAKEAAIGALLNLSSLESNASILINAGLLQQLFEMMVNVYNSLNPLALKLKMEAASTLACIVSAPRISMEDTRVDLDGNTLHSEYAIHTLLGLLTHQKPDWKEKLLDVLIGISSSSPQAAESVCNHVRSGHGFQLLLQITEPGLWLSVLKLLGLLSARKGDLVGKALSEGNKLGKLTDSLKCQNMEENVAVACVISNIPYSEEQVLRYLGVELIGWGTGIINDAKNVKHSKSFTRLMDTMIEGVMGILLHFVQCRDQRIINELKEKQVMRVFLEKLQVQGQGLVKQRAALGVKYLSEKTPQLTKQPKVTSPSCFQTLYRYKSQPLRLCSVHSGICDANLSFCLVEAKGISPLIELLEEEEEKEDEVVQLAAVEALCSLVMDGVNLRGGVEEIGKVEGSFERIFDLFLTQKCGVLQERMIWLIERVSRIEEICQMCSVSSSLTKGLIEALKRGNPNTKLLAQETLTHLKQLSGISAGVRRKKNK